MNKNVRRALWLVIPSVVAIGLILAICGVVHSVKSNHMSVGIIGGADGPTSILVSTAPLSSCLPFILIALFLVAATAALVIYLRKK